MRTVFDAGVFNPDMLAGRIDNDFGQPVDDAMSGPAAPKSIKFDPLLEVPRIEEATDRIMAGLVASRLVNETTDVQTFDIYGRALGSVTVRITPNSEYHAAVLQLHTALPYRWVNFYHKAGLGIMDLVPLWRLDRETVKAHLHYQLAVLLPAYALYACHWTDRGMEPPVR